VKFISTADFLDHDECERNDKGFLLHLCSHSTEICEGVSKSFQTGRLERELQMVQLSATK
jgi:hypothetical protein